VLAVEGAGALDAGQLAQGDVDPGERRAPEVGVLSAGFGAKVFDHAVACLNDFPEGGVGESIICGAGRLPASSSRVMAS